MGTDRRTFLKSAAGGLALAGVRAGNNKPLVRGALSNLGNRKAKTPVTNIVVVMMENRSMNHFLGWYGKENPSFNGRQQMSFPDLRAGKSGDVHTYNWGVKGFQSFNGRGYKDPSHSWDGGRAEKALGKVNGWLHPITKNDEYALSFYDDIDVPVWAQLARAYQSYDNWHAALLGPTQPNRYYMHSGSSGGNKNNDPPPTAAGKLGHDKWYTGFNWPTVWDLFDKAGMSAGYYASNLPVLGYWGRRHVNRIKPIELWYEQCQAGVLPQVSYVDPFFTIGSEFGNDDHPHADIRLGQAFLSDIVETFTNSRHYQQGALVVTYDEWGGFWDHVDPPRIADDRGTPNDPGGKQDFAQIGFRIPSTIVSPWTAKPGAVDHNLYEHTSVVRFISDNWGLPHLTRRVKSTNSIEGAFGGFRRFNPEHTFVPYSAPLSVALDQGEHAVRNFVRDEANDPTKLPSVGKIPGTPPWPLPPVFPPEPPKPGPHAAADDPAEGLQEALEMGWFEKLKIRTDYKLEHSFAKSRPELLREANSKRS